MNSMRIPPPGILQSMSRAGPAPRVSGANSIFTLLSLFVRISCLRACLLQPAGFEFFRQIHAERSLDRCMQFRIFRQISFQG